MEILKKFTDEAYSAVSGPNSFHEDYAIDDPLFNVGHQMPLPRIPSLRFLFRSLQPEQTSHLAEGVQPEQTSALAEGSQPEQTSHLAEGVQPEQTSALAEGSQPKQKSPALKKLNHLADKAVKDLPQESLYKLFERITLLQFPESDTGEDSQYDEFIECLEDALEDAEEEP
eukprot:GHVP01039998.1.p1 GENE.GHVP01039998.1~~GHVP01039998.1.p1  ORF type:complete len:171 (-),score=40.06 GHVP01039998.1:136-648(-)